jgi:glycosyltransferase involved in cell wall biosynthesis
MNIRIVTPAPAHSRKGNRITALRWARILRDLGHRVTIEDEYAGARCDLLIALHARRSFPSVERFRREHPELPLVLALTGTDLYRDIHSDASARQALEMATRLVVLQPMGVTELPAPVREKARVIYQSVQVGRAAAGPRGAAAAEAVEPDLAPAILERRRSRSRQAAFQVCVLGHLRPVKDPFRAAQAARLLPESSRIQLLHVGGALSPEMEEQAAVEEAANPRYRWLGELPRWRALQVLARSRLLVLTSEMEGGANVVCEAIALSVPVLSSRISGSIGILGSDYPGYFPVGDTQTLAALLERGETDAEFYRTLQAWCERLKPLVDPARERESWKSLLQELQPRVEKEG